MGYHKKEIKRGVYGEVSKIIEEMEEFLDSLDQNNSIMQLVELSDLILAIHGYVENKFRMSIEDIIIMAKATKSAFDDGSRKPK